MSSPSKSSGSTNDLSRIIAEAVKFIVQLDVDELLKDYSAEYPRSILELVDLFHIVTFEKKQDSYRELTLCGATLAQYKSIASELFHALSKKNSHTQVQSVFRIVDEAIVKHVLAREANRESDKSVRETLSCLVESKWNDYDVLIPIRCLQLKKGQHLDYQGVRFQKLTERVAERRYGIGAPRHLGWSKKLRDRWNSDTIGPNYGACTIRSFDERTAQEVGLHRVQSAVASLNFIGGLHYRYDLNTGPVRVHDGSVRSYEHAVAIVKLKNQNEGWSLPHMIQHEYELRIDDVRNSIKLSRPLKLLSKIGINAPSESMESNVQLATVWCGRAMWESDKTLALLYFMTSLEALFPLSKTEISESISLYCASLMNTNASAKAMVYRLAKSMYATRSEIVHGERIVLTESVVRKARWLATNTILNVLYQCKRPSLITMSTAQFNEYMRSRMLR